MHRRAAEARAVTTNISSAFMRDFLKYACMPSTAKRAFKCALVITPILTVFNHFSEIRELRLVAGFWIQVGLTFIVPYGVSTFSSARAAIEQHKNSRAGRHAA